MGDRVEEPEVVELRGRVERLSEVVDGLAARLGQLESALNLGGDEDQQATPPPETAAPTGQQSHILLQRASIVCFVLLGAQLLRYLTRGGLVPVGLGLGLGLAYSGALLFAPTLIARRRSNWPHRTLLEVCGGLLAPLMILEAVHRGGELTVPQAAMCLGGLGLATAALGLLGRSSVTVTGVSLCVVATTAALGLTPAGAVLRGGILVGMVAIAHLISRRAGPSYLRPLVTLPVLLLLGAGIVLTGRRAGIPPHVPTALLSCLLASWSLIGLNYALRRKTIDQFERAGLFVATLLTYGLGSFLQPAVAGPAGAALASLSLAVGILGRGKSAPASVTSDLTSLGALLAVISFPVIDPTCAALAVLSHLVLRATGQNHAWRWTGVWARLLAIAAAIAAVFRGVAISHAGGLGALPALLTGLVCAAVLLHYYLDVRRVRGDDRGGGLAVVTLVSGLVLAAVTAVMIAKLLFADAANQHLVLTVALACACIALLASGRRYTAPKVLGLLGLVLLGLKVLLFDMGRQEGLRLLVSLSTLGVAALLASIVTRAGKQPDKRPREDQTDDEADSSRTTGADE
jgi:hypothetical protein